MKPASFDILKPTSISEVVDLLSEWGDEASIVAGAQSLGPMLNLRLVRPRVLVDVTGIADMTVVQEDEDGVTIGACVTTASIEDGRLPCTGFPMLSIVAAGIAYRAVRNRGTIGGSLCHADPAADWPSALCGLGASCIVAGPTGRRTVPVLEFIIGAFETTLSTDECLVAIRVPRLSRQARWGYQKLCRKTGEFAMALGVVMIDPERDIYRMTFGATEGRQIEIQDFRSLRRSDGMELDEAALAATLADRGVSNPVACRQQVTVMQRAFRQALS